RSYFPSANTIPRHSRRKNSSVVESEIRTNVTMADRTMEELLQDPSEGYREAIVILEILAENFEIKTNLLQFVQANKFYGRENDNPHTHINNFKRMTATLKYRDVPNDAIKLMLFPYSLEDRAKIPRHSRRKNSSVVESEIRTNVTMADRTMEELLQDPSEGYREAIVILEILAENFEIKTNLLQFVQANKFYGRENDNPHTHINNFKRMTATLKYRDVPNDAIKLMLFPYSLEDRARI
nr:reverse transcriptase domain-containing protein [Tanacetum cinerariifolium]